MKIEDIKIGQKVKGYHYKGVSVGSVIKKLKTVVYVDFDGYTVKYDTPHLQFLTAITGENNVKF